MDLWDVRVSTRNPFPHSTHLSLSVSVRPEGQTSFKSRVRSPFPQELYRQQLLPMVGVARLHCRSISQAAAVHSKLKGQELLWILYWWLDTSIMRSLTRSHVSKVRRGQLWRLDHWTDLPQLWDRGRQEPSDSNTKQRTSKLDLGSLPSIEPNIILFREMSFLRLINKTLMILKQLLSTQQSVWSTCKGLRRPLSPWSPA